ncbi:MAG: tetratricopeptide repeat protein, partial [Patescibacteria group bacterium]
GVLAGSVKLRRTPFDLPIVLFVIAALLSAIFAVNRADSFISFVPFLFAALLYFLITNSVKRAQDVMFLQGSLILGAIIVGAVTFLSYLKIYVLPFPFAKAQTFTPLGSLFDQLLYLALVLSLCLYMAWPALKRRVVEKGRLIFVIGAFFVLIGSFVTLLGVVTLQKPVILPFQTGFQIGFASISQDSGRVVQGFLMGSGLGTFLADFTRFKPAAFNLNQDLWNLTFLRSSSFILELIATTGLLGILSFLFLAFRIIRTKPLFIPLILALVFALIFPFAFSTILVFFVLIALFSAQQGLVERQKQRFFDVELKLVTLRRGVFALSDPGHRSDSEYGNLLPYALLIIIIGFSILLGVAVGRFVVSDYLFQKSLVSASQNNAQKTYQLETRAIQLFPQRDGYHRIFSQINLSIANNIASGIPKDQKPPAQTQNTIYQLIQQSINSARLATTVSPATSMNWQNLSSIYRSLLGFGQNADTFAVIANQQALTLDPNNPQQYINYGGIFYQLGQWDNAIRQFQIATSLKPDFANAYYNLGHALEQKGDLQQALVQYQRVKSLIANDKKSLAQIDSEIKTLQEKIGKAETASNTEVKAAENQPPLEVNKPAAKLPEQNPPVKIPGPKGSPTPTPKVSPSPTPTN